MKKINLEEQLKLIDLEKQAKLVNLANLSKPVFNDMEKIDSIKISDFKAEELNEIKKIGSKEISLGKLAIVTLAGGQGTRLGFNGPKGSYILTNNKSLFEILADNLKSGNEKFDTVINWYIMTSTENDEDTKIFFQNNNYFNYPKQNITFFKQNNLPMNKFNGDFVLNEEGLIKFASDGHGGTFDALYKNDLINDMKAKNIEWVYVTPVDNPLIELVDDIFVGMAKKNNYELLSKTIIKNPGQKSGVFCLRNGKLSVAEYTEIPDELANKVDEDGKLYFGNAHINCNLFNISAIEKVKDIEIPYHIAKKKASFLDENGNFIKPEEPNAFKYEKFIFDYFPYLDKTAIYLVDRNFEYEPIKDKAEKAREAYMRKINNTK